MSEILIDENLINSFEIIINSMIEVLTQSGNSNRTYYLEDILESLKDYDSNKFKDLVISNELFGGAGAYWEIWINDKKLNLKYQKIFIQLIDALEKVGIFNPRIQQVKEGLYQTINYLKNS